MGVVGGSDERNLRSNARNCTFKAEKDDDILHETGRLLERIV